MTEPTLAVDAGGGAFDPYDSSDDEDSKGPHRRRSRPPKMPWKSPRKDNPYKSRDKLTKDQWPFNLKRYEPKII